MKRKRLVILPFLAYSIACGTAMSPAAPLEMSLTASRSTVATGDSVDFSVQARGASLVGVEIDFGDSATDLKATGGATSARVTFRHAYGASGTYMARAVITDAQEGQRDATVEVHVN